MPTDSGKKIDIVLAEYQALSSETIAHHSAQSTLVSVTLTAVGVIASVVLSDGTADGSSFSW